VRLFVGIELEARLRAACAAAAQELDDRLREQRIHLRVRWIPEHNLHITLWFLGEVADAQVAALSESLSRAWNVPPFALTISGAGAFPPSGPPRIVWLGTTSGSDRVAAIHAELTTRLAPLGFEPERRPYHPHVTIGRIKEVDRGARRARAVFTGANLAPGSCDVTHVTLFQSRLSPAGARYEPLLRVPLMGC
jgi:2'-5' RNA ligase